MSQWFPSLVQGLNWPLHHQVIAFPIRLLLKDSGGRLKIDGSRNHISSIEVAS